MSKKLTFSDFRLAKFTFEIRYEAAYLLWDNAGRIWDNAKKIWPELEVQTADPNKTNFKMGSNITLTIELQKAFVIFHRKRIKDSIPIMEKFLTLILEFLKVESYSRIGFRVVYEKEFDNNQEASEAFLKLNKLQIPKAKIFNIDGKVSQPTLQFKLENEDLGVAVCLKTQTNKINMDVPPEIANIMEPVHSEQNLMVVDLDYYTKTSTKPGQFNVSEWVTQIDHVIRRDLNTFIGDT